MQDQTKTEVIHPKPNHHKEWKQEGTMQRKPIPEDPGWTCKCGHTNEPHRITCEECNAPRPEEDQNED